MSFEIPHRGPSATPGTGVRPSFEGNPPNLTAPTPLPPVAQSVDQKSSIRSQNLAHPEQKEPDQEQLEKPSLNRNFSSLRSGRTHNWGVDDNDDRSKNIAKSYHAINAHDFASPPRRFAQSKDYTDPSYDPRFLYYDHPYYNYPYQGPPPPPDGSSPPRAGSIRGGPPPNGSSPPRAGSVRGGPPHASWRSNATAAPPPSRGSRNANLRFEDPLDSESEDEQHLLQQPPQQQQLQQPPQQQKLQQPPQQMKVKVQHQRPLAWGYDDMSQMTVVPQTQEVIMRLPFRDWMNSGLRAHMVSALAEFVGTVMFLFFAFAGTQVANINANSTEAAASTTGGSTGFSPIVLLYIALSFGSSLMVNVWVFYRISGGLFNPAVTLGMMMVKSVTYTRGFLLVCAQIAGSIVTSLIVKALFPTDFNVRTTLSPGTSLAQGVFIEALLTAELVFAIFMLAKEKHRATYLAPIGIGVAMFVAELVGVYYTGGSLNPARSLGPCVVTGIWDKEHWIYWVGPGCGAIGAVGFYNFIKMLEYEMANPGQDSTSEDKAAREADAVREKKEEEAAGLA